MYIFGLYLNWKDVRMTIIFIFRAKKGLEMKVVQKVKLHIFESYTLAKQIHQCNGSLVCKQNILQWKSLQKKTRTAAKDLRHFIRSIDMYERISMDVNWKRDQYLSVDRKINVISGWTDRETTQTNRMEKEIGDVWIKNLHYGLRHSYL